MNELFSEIQNAAQVIAEPNYADKAAILISAIAALLAFAVAYRQVGISKQQNKISLFELRYKMYNCILTCNHFAKMLLLLAKDDKDVAHVYKMTIGKKSSPAKTQRTDDSFLISEMADFVSELGKTEFLFPQDVAEYSNQLAIVLMRIITNPLIPDKDYIEPGKTALQEVLDTFEGKRIGAKMKVELQLASKPNWFARYIKRGHKR